MCECSSVPHGADTLQRYYSWTMNEYWDFSKYRQVAAVQTQREARSQQKADSYLCSAFALNKSWLTHCQSCKATLKPAWRRAACQSRSAISFLWRNTPIKHSVPTTRTKVLSAAAGVTSQRRQLLRGPGAALCVGKCSRHKGSDQGIVFQHWGGKQHNTIR